MGIATPFVFLFNFFNFILALQLQFTLILAPEPACRNTCGSLQVKYPFGTGSGCGSPLLHAYVTCASGYGNTDSDQLILKTHAGTYPITSISYTKSTLIISPPYMSTCTTMQNSPNLGLDWASPFQLGPSTLILLSCQAPTSSLFIRGSPICDPSRNFLCDSIYTCPGVVTLGLAFFPPANTCCVYSPANLNEKGELDLRNLNCRGYAPVVSLGDYPTDPTKWEYGVALKYNIGILDNNIVESQCNGCEMSGGVCGYSPSGNSFVCVCGNGLNSSSDCYHYSQVQDFVWGSSSSPAVTRYIWSGPLVGLVLCLVVWRTERGIF